MWLIASPLCVLVYLLTTYWTKSKLFTYISLGGVVSTLLAVLQVTNAPMLVLLLSFGMLFLGILLLSRALQGSRFADFTFQPLILVAQVGMPVLIILAISTWLQYTGCTTCSEGSPWLLIILLALGVVFYVLSEIFFTSIEARWASAVLFPIPLVFSFLELELSDTFLGVSMMVVSLAYLGVGYTLTRREEQKRGGLPLYVVAYALALVVTFTAAGEPSDLILILFGDVILLALSAFIHEDNRWVYGAAWLLMLPIYLLIDINVRELHNQGLLMGLMGLNYAAVGYALGRRQLRLGGPFLSAAAFLSVLTVGLTWGNPTIASIVLGVIAVLYLLSALWTDWVWLLLPTLISIDLMILSLTLLLVESNAQVESLAISYTAIGVVFALLSLPLDRLKARRWEWPLILVSTLNLSGAYLAGLFITGPIAIGQSIILAILMLSFSWIRRREFDTQKQLPFLSYFGLLILFTGHFYFLNEVGFGIEDAWPAYTAGFCGLFVVLAWPLQRGELERLYSVPMRRLGTTLLAIPLFGAIAVSLWNATPLLGAVTFAIAGLTFLGDAAMRKVLHLVYLSAGSFLVVIWAVLISFDIEEPQAYVAPIVIALLGIGWNERRRGLTGTYQLSTFCGLAILLGTSFVQSLAREGILYAILLGVESIATLAWGIYHRTRAYVRLAIIAFLANGIMQLGPGFVALPRWIQIGLTGGILFGGGLLALFKREELIRTRSRITEQWKEWGA
jgi:hypothetical protein